MKRLVTVTLVTLMLLTSGCATRDNGSLIAKAPEVDVMALMEQASVDLLANSHGLDDDKAIIVATFVNIDDLKQSSTLGRTLAEIFATGLVRAGLTVVEVKMRDSLFIEETTGELILSRDVHRLSATHDAQAVLIGTYAQAETSAYVNVRLVRTRDNVILGASSVQLPLDRNLRAMLPTAW